MNQIALVGTIYFPEADRQLRQVARLDNVSASVALHHFEKGRTQLERVEKKAAEQFLAAALNKPKVYKTRLQKSFYETATARRDSEEAERVRWVSERCTLLLGTPTPMGKLLVEKPSSESLVGAGKRAATLRSRVRMARRYLAWFSDNFEVTFPNRVEHFTEFLKVRVSEPCNRGALRNAHRGFGFLDETAGVTPEDSVTMNPIFHEMLSKAIPGRSSKQAPRMPVALILAIEKFLMDTSNLPYMRLYAWFMALLNWATIRFSDHRGILPESISWWPSGFTAVLSRSKTLGSDKNVLSRPLRVDNSCFV